MKIQKAIICILVIGIGIIFSFTGCTTDESSTAANAKTVTKLEATTAPTAEPTAEPKVNFAPMDITVDNIKLALGSVIDADKFKNAEITTEKGKTIVDIYYNPGKAVWDEKDLMNKTCQTATAAMEILFSNPKIDKVWFWTQTTMTDAKGNDTEENVINVCLTKENAKDINWSKFKVMVYGDYESLINIADSSFIYPSIKAKL